MSATIVKRTIGAVTDQRIKLSNSYIVRKIGVTETWGTIRIGARFTMVPGGTDNLDLTGTPRFGFGLCASTTSPYGSQTPDHFWGLRSSLATWYYKNSNPDYFGALGGVGLEYQPIKIQNGSITTGAFGTTAQKTITTVAEPSSNRVAAFVDITKAGANMSFIKHGPASAASVQADITPNQFWATMDVTTALTTNSPITGYTISDTVNIATAGANVAADEVSFGTLDHICFYWDRAGTLIELGDVAYAVKA